MSTKSMSYLQTLHSNTNTPDAQQQTADTRYWFRVFAVCWAVLALAKLWLAVYLPLFGDEAFYWQESRELALAYSDLPGLTAWLIAAGTAVFGQTPLGVRSVFLLLGAAMPWLLAWLALRVLPPVQAWQAALLSLCLPLFSTLGVLALPDVPLMLLVLLATLLWLRAHQDQHWWDWPLLGLVLMLGAWCHYRFGLMWLLGAALLMFAPAYSESWRRPGLWLALALGALGWLPILLFNLQQDWSGASFQLLERHPWEFHPRGLRQPLEQLLVLTPVLGVLLLMRLPELLRRAQQAAAWQLLAGLCLAHLLIYATLGLFADQQRMRVHWMIAGYLPLLLLLPAWASTRMRRGVLVVAAALGALGGAGILLALAMIAGNATLPGAWQNSRYYPDNFVGWREIAERSADLLTKGEYSAVVADNFMLGAQLDFELADQASPWVLDHPLNAKHGRARQLAIWGRDASALHTASGQRVLLLLEDTAISGYQRLDWYHQACAHFDQIEPLDHLALHNGRKQISWFAARFRDVDAPGLSPEQCSVPPFGYIDSPARRQHFDSTVAVRGWALGERAGIAEVLVELGDGRRIEASYGLPAAHVHQAFPASVDAANPDVGYAVDLDLPAGTHQLRVLLHAGDGQIRALPWREFTVGG